MIVTFHCDNLQKRISNWKKLNNDGEELPSSKDVEKLKRIQEDC